MNMLSQDTFSSMFEQLDNEAKTRLCSHFFNLMQIFVGQSQAILSDEEITPTQTVSFMRREMHDFLKAVEDVLESEMPVINPTAIN